MLFSPQNIKISIIGLGYVGLPLALEFAKKYKVTGFDISTERIKQLIESKDITREVSSEQISNVIVKSAKDLENQNGFYPTSDLDDIKNSTIYIVTVPTPVDSSNRPDLTPLHSASTTVGKVIKKGDVVIYESTTYPGCTEEECVPIIEKISGLTYNRDFFAGYSPERINPGDKINTLTNIKKVTSGSTPQVAKFVNNLYSSIITAGTYQTSCIKVAESAKVIENSQRDINIAFVNELAKIFNLLGVDTTEVLEAAGTKWNFLPFKPGLVGGHCIGVDPYYLAQKAMELGYHSEIILAGRRLNDSMPYYIASEVIKLMIKKDIIINNSDILILGITFKENCPDVRNTKVVNIVKCLDEYDLNITICDPLANPKEVKHEYGLDIFHEIPNSMKFDTIILAVPHQEFKEMNIKKYCKDNAVIYDCKSFLDKKIVDARL
ncbi:MULTISPECIES: nucleotide sugar dehydrogenase [unclassified Apibacter]|uniref:nucleotide sugar dehydrogenase n=1 Tax=unclassified Apibacter TaxID=2630820 RepID=UPI00135DC7B6|nr:MULTISPECIES: nucleotide sugar dehydrogenase [unclassified Apibacter]MXP05777.1 nucleotide sugar dehydrogenase [Apibacter sp. B3546]MXP11817.1 nucleotide sugar dehydrogenase [Apibacter sp. B3239]